MRLFFHHDLRWTTTSWSTNALLAQGRLGMNRLIRFDKSFTYGLGDRLSSGDFFSMAWTEPSVVIRGREFVSVGGPEDGARPG